MCILPKIKRIAKVNPRAEINKCGETGIGELGKRLQLMAASAFWSIPALETQVLPNRKTWKLIPLLPSIETLKMINIVAQNKGFLAKQTIFEIDGQPVCTPGMQHASRVSAFPEQFPNVEKLQACQAWPKPERRVIHSICTYL